MKFHEKLQKLRREAGLSQEMLAEKLDVSRQAVSKWESGQTYPEMDKLIALCELFQISLDHLVRDGELEDGAETPGMGMGAHPLIYAQPSYEYKSSRTLWGLPLVHVNIGRGRRAKGVVAVGIVASGIVSLGVLSAGVVSLGVLSVGLLGLGALSLGALLATGAIAVGTVSVGGIAIGVFALGGLAIGMFATGGLAVASHIAVGDHAYGQVAVGRVAEGARVFLDHSLNRNFSEISAAEVRAAIHEEFPRLPGWIARTMTALFR